VHLLTTSFLLIQGVADGPMLIDETEGEFSEQKRISESLLRGEAKCLHLRAINKVAQRETVVGCGCHYINWA
jgi:hypothetical protein